MQNLKVAPDEMVVEVTNRVRDGMRQVIKAEFLRLIEEGYEPYHLRFGMLIAHLSSMADVIGASGDEEDRMAMRAFVTEVGPGMLIEMSEALASYASEMDARSH